MDSETPVSADRISSTGPEYESRGTTNRPRSVTYLKNRETASRTPHDTLNDKKCFLGFSYTVCSLAFLSVAVTDYFSDPPA